MDSSEDAKRAAQLTELASMGLKATKLKIERHLLYLKIKGPTIKQYEGIPLEAEDRAVMAQYDLRSEACGLNPISWLFNHIANKIKISKALAQFDAGRPKELQQAQEFIKRFKL